MPSTWLRAERLLIVNTWEHISSDAGSLRGEKGSLSLLTQLCGSFPKASCIEMPWVCKGFFILLQFKIQPLLCSKSVQRQWVKSIPESIQCNRLQKKLLNNLLKACLDFLHNIMFCWPDKQISIVCTCSLKKNNFWVQLKMINRKYGIRPSYLKIQ